MKKYCHRFYQDLGIMYIDTHGVFGDKDDHRAIQTVKFNGKEFKVLYHGDTGRMEFSLRDLQENPLLGKLIECLENDTLYCDSWDAFRIVTILRCKGDVLNTRAFTDMPERVWMNYQEIFGDDYKRLTEDGTLKKLEYNKFCIRLLETVIDSHKRKNSEDPFSSLSDLLIEGQFSEFFWENWNSSGVYS